MKKFSVILTVMFCFGKTFAQTAATEVISTLRMGAFKLNMTKAEIEKATGLTLPAFTAEYMDTVPVNYKGAVYTLVFNHDYNEDTKKPVVWKLYSAASTNTALKTKSQIGLGSTKAAILQAYDKFDITIYNDYQFKEKGNAKDKIQYIRLEDGDSGTSIMFTTENRVVTAIAVEYIEGD